MHSFLRAACCAALLATAAMAGGADMPTRKSGLWEVTTAVNGRPASAGALQQCVDSKTDDVMSRGGVTGVKCSRQDVTRKGDRIEMHSVCDFGQTRATTTGVFAGSFDSAYRAELKTSYDPPMMGMKESAITINAKWLGPCKPGQKPGDIVMPGGRGGFPVPPPAKN